MSIASIAAGIKQRQKIAHSAGYWKRLEEAKEGTIPAKVTTDLCTCANCGFKAYYKFIRCPECSN